MPEEDGEQVRLVGLDPKQGHPGRRLGNQQMLGEAWNKSLAHDCINLEGGGNRLGKGRVRMGPGQPAGPRLCRGLG